MRPRPLSLLVPIVAVAFLAVGVLTPVVGAQTPGTTVRVVLSEFVVKPTPKSAPAGTVNFAVKNRGDAKHEMMIVKGDDPKALATKANGSVDEAKIPAADVVGHIENVKPKKTKTATFQLSAGSYILLCNIVDPAEHSGHLVSGFHEDDHGGGGGDHEHSGHDPSHFKEKMYTVFTVT